MDIYIKNLHPNLGENELRVLFEPFGPVISTSIVRDKETGASKGFGFVKMNNAIDAQRAIVDMDGRELGGKTLGVQEAIPKDQKKTATADPYNSYERDVDSEPNYSRSRRDIDDDGWATVRFEKGKKGDEGLILEVQDEAEFSKSVLEDGLIKITFKN